jgi:protein-tyrosine phosphatase
VPWRPGSSCTSGPSSGATARLATLAVVFFVDCHSHVVPSGDDGAQSVDEAVELCRSAAAHGTRLLFATPHVWPQLPLPADREARVRAAHERVAARAGLELRLGWELTPSEELLYQDLARYALAGLDTVLMEVPFTGPADLLWALAERAEAQGLLPVIAHPERTEAALDRPDLGHRLAERGWAVQVNATSLLGRHGRDAERMSWELVETGDAALVASDGHRASRPAHLDGAHALVAARVGEERATRLFDGSTLGLSVAARAA